MTCHDIGTLQAYLDGEVSREEKKRIMKHLENCAICRGAVSELQQLQAFYENKLDLDGEDIDVARAWARFEENLEQGDNRKSAAVSETTSRKGWSPLKTKTKRFIVSGVAAAAIFSSLAIPQVQVGANQFLSLFRVDQFEMVQLTQEDLEQVESWVSEHKAGEIDLKGLGKLERSVVDGELQQFQTIESAEQAGYAVPSFGEFGLSVIDVMPAQTMTFTLDVEKANQLLTQLEADEQFETVLDGKPFSVSIAETVKADYLSNGQYISYVRTESPEISVPEGTSIDQLRDTLLSLPFLPDNVKTQLANISDFETTLPVPVVDTEEAKVSEVEVNGAEGFTFVGTDESSIVWKQGEQLQMIMAETKMTEQQLMELATQVK
ncbi:zf-HC2 domain-containing protein [Planococcus alpniumensis]|uniref:zf-HC2 domain-containing protein n=1 Tax=Planococcus alpniumensis TaxID=2708345 RepID=UPI001B8B2C89|nr:zf-HC2 domain-containing protein [Planococcus sp. MSAK28401]